jgi:tol-pal system protein YbgF
LFKTLKHRCKALLLLVFICLFAQTACLSRTKFSNYGWQLDSLKYYTKKIDSLLEQQSDEIERLRIDFYTKSNELSDKIEMLHTRLGDTESQLTYMTEKIGSTPTPADSEDISQLSPEARLIYESAYLNYVKGNYPEAISGFESYLQVEPSSPLSDNALYWIGESYAAMGKSQSAVASLQALINKYPQSNKKPTALYKIAIIYEETGDTKTAKYYYNQIINDFPNSAEAALAKDKLQ